MLAGTLACLMTACVAGAIIGPDGSVPTFFTWQTAP
jgi:hypothetical protein